MDRFEEQIQQREKLDQQLFDDSFLIAAEIVLGRKAAAVMEEDRIVTGHAVEDILRYFHFRPVEIPQNIESHKEQVDHCLRPYGIMRRSIELEEGWYRHSFGPVLAYLKDGGTPVALIPNPFSGYYYYDRTTQKKIRLSAKEAELFRREAYCFYTTFPQKELGIRDILIYMY